MKSSNIRMHIIYYGQHTPMVDSTIIRVRPRYLIGNSAHSLWGEAYGHDPEWLLQDVGRFRMAGIKVIGYLTGGYEGKGSSSGIESKWCSLDMNRKLITNMSARDGVDGVFIDECSNYPDGSSKKYLKALSDLAHNCGLMVWGNVGLADFDEWFFTKGKFDIINASEDWRGELLTPIQEKWRNRISVTGFNSAYTVTDAYRLICKALDQGLASAYISNDEYLNLPTWIEELAARLRPI